MRTSGKTKGGDEGTEGQMEECSDDDEVCVVCDGGREEKMRGGGRVIRRREKTKEGDEETEGRKDRWQVIMMEFVVECVTERKKIR